MDKKRQKRISKFLSLVLRHQPDKIGIQLEESGWVEVTTLLEKLNANDKRLELDLPTLKLVVTENDKLRFQFNEDETKIRATQGHSVDVDLGYEPAAPPEILCHGTPEKFVAPIKEQGLQKQARHHVHLHQDEDLASDVGGRRGKPVLLKIRAAEMHQAGFQFFVTPNDVWLTDHVPPEFIEFPES